MAQNVRMELPTYDALVESAVNTLTGRQHKRYFFAQRFSLAEVGKALGVSPNFCKPFVG